MLIEGEIVEWVNKIQLGPDLRLKEGKQYEYLLCKYFHLFVFNYKDLQEVTMEQHKIELLPMPNRSGLSKGGEIQNTLQW